MVAVSEGCSGARFENGSSSGYKGVLCSGGGSGARSVVLSTCSTWRFRRPGTPGRREGGRAAEFCPGSFLEIGGAKRCGWSEVIVDNRANAVPD